MKKNYRTTALTAAIIASVIVLAVIYFIPWQFSEDETLNKLLRDVLPRAALSVAVFCLTLLCGYGGVFRVKAQGAMRNTLWLLPCLAVALVNFPYSALISGQAQITRSDLIWLFILKCLLIALSEEMLFRGIALGFLGEFLGERKHKYVLTVVISSAVFALFHLLNLFEGAGIGATLLQTGYTFLTGMMFASVTLRTGNIWAAVALHCIFDIGGLIIGDIGSGPFQDAIFWILTAVAAVICAVHLILYAIARDKAEGNSAKQ